MAEAKEDRQLVLYGADNSYGPEIAESAHRAGWNVIAGIATGKGDRGVSAVPAVLREDELSALLRETSVFPVAMVPGARKQQVARLRELGFRDFASVIDQTSVVSPSADIGRGCYLNVLAIVAARGELGDFVFIGRNSSLGHHSRMEDYCTLGPGVTIASHCHLGRGVMVGSGVTITPGRTIGANSVIAAGSVVRRDVPANTLVTGHHARVYRRNIAGYRDLGV